MQVRAVAFVVVVVVECESFFVCEFDFAEIVLVSVNLRIFQLEESSVVVSQRKQEEKQQMVVVMRLEEKPHRTRGSSSACV